MCHRTFTQRCHLLRHVRNAHGNLWSCATCKKTFKREANFGFHIKTCKFQINGVRPEPIQTGAGAIEQKSTGTFERVKDALNGTAQTLTMYLHGTKQKPDSILSVLKDAVATANEPLIEERNKKHAIKFYLSLHLTYHQAVDETVITDPPVVLHTEPQELYDATEVEESLEAVHKELERKIDAYEHEGSGWVLHQLLKPDLHILHLEPLRASTYIELPKWIQDKKAIVNIKNNDDSCFRWTYLAAAHAGEIGKNPQRLYHYKKYENELNFDGIEMPMKLHDITKFERLNNVSVSVYGAEEERKENGEMNGYFYPLKVVKEIKEKHVDMLLISKGETNHYCWIKNFSRLVGSQYSKNEKELAYCRFCLHGFYGSDSLGECTRLEDAKRRRDKHEDECFVHNGQKLVFPDEDVVEFTNIRKAVEAPFCVYADFESTLPQINEDSEKNKKQRNTKNMLPARLRTT